MQREKVYVYYPSFWQMFASMVCDSVTIPAKHAVCERHFVDLIAITALSYTSSRAIRAMQHHHRTSLEEIV